MARKTGLGRGLAALLGELDETRSAVSETATADASTTATAVAQVDALAPASEGHGVVAVGAGRAKGRPADEENSDQNERHAEHLRTGETLVQRMAGDRQHRDVAEGRERLGETQIGPRQHPHPVKKLGAERQHGRIEERAGERPADRGGHGCVNRDGRNRQLPRDLDEGIQDDGENESDDDRAGELRRRTFHSLWVRQADAGLPWRASFGLVEL